MKVMICPKIYKGSRKERKYITLLHRTVPCIKLLLHRTVNDDTIL